VIAHETGATCLYRAEIEIDIGAELDRLELELPIRDAVVVEGKRNDYKAFGLTARRSGFSTLRASHPAGNRLGVS
jgi:hypothetical protein